MGHVADNVSRHFDYRRATEANRDDQQAAGLPSLARRQWMKTQVRPAMEDSISVNHQSTFSERAALAENAGGSGKIRSRRC